MSGPSSSVSRRCPTNPTGVHRPSRETGRTEASRQGSGKAKNLLRWLVLPIGLVIAAAALYAVVSLDSVGFQEIEPPMDEIDDRSRAKLERVMVNTHSTCAAPARPLCVYALPRAPSL